VIRRGDVHLIDLELVRGSEADKRRPAVIVSNDAANATAARLGRGVVTVVPLTSNVRRVYPFQVMFPAALTGLERDSKAQAEQVRSIDVARVGVRLGTIPTSLISELEEALRLHLEL
jgi:mRNA interferase MazF